MKRSWHRLLLGLVVLGLVIGAAGCSKEISAEDQQTQELARGFMEAIFVKHDAALAMSYVGPFNTYGYVTQKIVDETIAAEVQKRCQVPIESLKPGPVSREVTIRKLGDADKAKGISQRIAWSVASTYTCSGQSSAAARTSVVVLEKVNDKWGVASVSFETGVGESHAFGLN
ncbi:MAG: hypothetical protein ACYC6L_00135 [Anaerolineae bacterium]